jgi:hypothetical protein
MSGFVEPNQKCTGKISDIKVAIDTCGGKSSHDGFTSLVSRGILCGNVSSINRFPEVLKKIEEKKESMTMTDEDKKYVETLKSCFGLFSEKKGDKCDTEMCISDDESCGKTSGESMSSLGVCSEDNIEKLQTTCDKNTLIREYCKFLKKYDDVADDAIYSEFTTMCNNDEKFKDFNPNNEPAASFMLTMIFCWKYADYLMKANETAGVQKGGDGEDKLVIHDLKDDESKYNHRRRIMIALSLFAQIFFLFLLFEQFRLLFTTIERILEVAADFNNDTGHTVLGFFDAGQQILLGNMVNTLLGFQGAATSRIEKSIRSIALEGQRTVQSSYIRGFATAVNDYLTGSSMQFVTESAKEEARFQQQLLLQEGIHDINVQYNNLTMETQSLTYGIINGIQGFMTSSILLIHYVDPNIVNAGQVTQAIGALTTSFAAPASWANMVALVNNVRLATGSTIGLLQGVSLPDDSSGMDVVESPEPKEGGKKKRKRTQKRTQKKKKGGKKKRKRTQKKKKGGKKKSTRKRK